MKILAINSVTTRLWNYILWLPADKSVKVLLAILAMLISIQNVAAADCDDMVLSTGEVIWCDSFEDVDLPPSGDIADNYFDYSADAGRQTRSTDLAYDGDYSLKQSWQQGDVEAGHLFRTFGRNPVFTQSHSASHFREIYWRIFVYYPVGTTEFPNKLTRAMVFGNSNWAQAMIAHVWVSSQDRQFLLLDPASGTDSSGNLLTTKWNDFENLRWLGSRKASSSVSAGVWQCIEARVRLNDAGLENGQFDLWMDGELVASQSELNWLGAYDNYGLNAVMLSGYWNGGAPSGGLDRYLDSFVIASGRIGCKSEIRPLPPQLH